MKKYAMAVLLAAGLLDIAALGQGATETPPQVISVELAACRDEQAPPGFTCFSFGGFGCPGDFGLLEPIDPFEDVLSEQDVLFLRITIFDADFDEDPDEDDGGVIVIPPPQADSEDIFVRRAAPAIPVFVDGIPYNSPTPPAIPEALFRYVQYEGLEFNGVIDQRVMCLGFTVPRFLGRSQARLRGIFNFDVIWDLTIEIANDEDPEANELVVLRLPILAIKDDRFLGPNPQAFADAGADNTFVAGTTVALDASRTFDAFNVGFDDDLTSVIERDTITYAWEWVSGPVRVDPVYPNPELAPEVAEVTLTQIGTYVYRVTVDDNFNALPTQDTVTINVVSALPENRQPVARITAPIGNVTVGAIIQLNAGQSIDPDGDPLTYRWIQTDELGAPVDPALFVGIFQPLGGLTSPVSSWQALRPGTYFFRLIISDGRLTDTRLVSVTVVDAPAVSATDGGGAPRGNERDPVAGQSSDDATTTQNRTMPTACGAGMLGCMFAPLALWLARRRS